MYSSLLIGILLDGILLPSLDGSGNNAARFAVAFGIQGIGVVRWVIARIRQERNRDWRLYVILICIAPFLSLLLFYLWKAVVEPKWFIQFPPSNY